MTEPVYYLTIPGGRKRVSKEEYLAAHGRSSAAVHEPAPVALGPTDLDGAMASLDAFHRTNGLPPIAARNAKAPPIRAPAPMPVTGSTVGIPSLSYEQQMQAGADAARRLLHPEPETIEQQARRAQAIRVARVQEEDRRATKAKAERQAGAEAARALLGR